jgi:Amt family ammonium transporter
MNRKRLLIASFIIGALMMLAISALTPASSAQDQQAQPAASPPPTGDPTGEKTGTVSDVPAKEPGNPTLPEIMDAVGHNKIAINIVWTLITGFLVMFMQAGFAMVETGFCRAKNAAHTMSMNFMVYAIGLLGYWVCGFALHFGGNPQATLGGTLPLSHEVAINLLGKPFGLFGAKGFFLSWDAYDVGVFALFLFQMVFMDTAATIPTGAMAERWKFSSFVVYGFFMACFAYPLFGNWVWGGGWLSQLGTNFGLGHGHVDFAGSSVVHQVGGMAALAGAVVLGPRIGKYTKDGKPVAIPGHHIPMAIIGTFILAFGWFGFNPGSTLSGTDLRIAVVATNTLLASGAGAFAAMLYVWKRTGKPDPSMMANGMLAGLVAITAPCAFVTSWAAVLIGLIAGVLVVESVYFVERKLKVDDPVGAISVHGTCGSWGVLSLGLFADGAYGDGWNGVPGRVTGLFYGAPKQFFAELIGTVTCFLFVFTSFYLFFKAYKAIWGVRVPPEVELAGLDIPEMGVLGYPDFVLSPTSTGAPDSGVATPVSPQPAVGVSGD